MSQPRAAADAPPSEIEISRDAAADTVHLRRDGAETFTLPLSQVLPLIRSLQNSVRHLPPYSGSFPPYLNAPDDGLVDFSEEEILISLYAEPVEDEEEFERRTMVMRRVTAALYACAGISTPALKRMRMPPPEPASAKPISQ